MKKRTLPFPKGYNRTTQKQIGSFAAQLDDQLRLLKLDISGLTTKQLEWQPHKGVNTIGMLVAHLAIVEVWWINIVAKELPAEPDGEKLLKKVTGINGDDDGLPLKKDGIHSKALKGYTLKQYLTMLNKARLSVHKELRTWRDKDLNKTYRRRKFDISYEWTIYHVLEHFSGHYGQILLLKHLMQDAGVLKRPKTK
jgi:hypothetical protein